MDILNNESNKKDFLQMSKYEGKTFVIKYGGSIMSNDVAKEAFVEDIELMTKAGIKVVIVHGGGPLISKWVKKSGGENKFIKGLRVTSKDTMEIVEMVLSGNVNKRLASILSLRGLNAIGISGRDSNLIQAKKKYIFDDDKKIDIGFVGEVANINTKVLLTLLKNKYIPVISPVGVGCNGDSYNINADYAAAAISGVLKAEKLLIMTDIGGVYTDITDPTTLLSSITVAQTKEFINKGMIYGGMIPKLECCVAAIDKGAKNVHLVDGRKKHGLLLNIIKDSGTKIITAKGVI
ncbi:acetylglutamate kinase [Clostridium estertheticum]|uniref:acetylglutamate kinase n=1 Tax=Clostridium estertheticum TaxID=238834 RepID=UPI001C7D1A89|nr:acetylglutamate kinase [Clostridium estertheticum]MBX4269699.1 acetylglutamate kinase [Clostridium estertheticum]WLC77877.1 acetylglutamate kinase [Clostridium estertheticum]